MAREGGEVEKVNKKLKDKHAHGHATDKEALAKIRERTGAAEEGNGKPSGKKGKS
jgi:hypothetical protein